MNTTNEEQLAIERRRARFNADVAQTVRVIAERYRASGAVLTGDVARAILDEAFADVGLASRWPDDAIAALAQSIEIPAGSTELARNEDDHTNALLQSLFAVFHASERADA
jgi:hypothetical protein